MREGQSRSYFDYRLRLQVPSDSPDRMLLEYIKHEAHLTYSEKEMVLAALRMCWLPLAYREQTRRTGEGSHETLQQIGLDCIMRLKEQIQYIAAATGIQTTGTLSDRPWDAGASNHATSAVRPIPPEPDGYKHDVFGES